MRALTGLGALPSGSQVLVLQDRILHPRPFPRTIALALAAVALLAAPARATMPPVSGTFPDEVRDALAHGLLALPDRPALGVSAAQTHWRVPIILVAFAGDSLVYGPADFQHELFDTTGAVATGSASDYYRWVSDGRFQLTGDVVAVVQLPHDKAYYGYSSWGLNRVSTPNNDAGLVRDALYACEQSVNWANYDLDHDGYVDMLWVVHAGIGGEGSRDRNDLWSITSRLQGFWNSSYPYQTHTPIPGNPDRYILIDSFSMLPEKSWLVPGGLSEIGVYCHEFGHALGLPDLYDTRDGGAVNSGPGNWSLMSTGVYGGDGHSPQSPAHMGAWCMTFLGWSHVLRPAADTTLDLDPIEEGGPVLDLSFQGDPDPEHFLLECRRQVGFDRTLSAEGLVISHVDERVMGQGLQGNTVNAGLTPGLQVVEADGRTDLVTGQDRGDAGDVFPGASNRTWLDDLAPAPSTRTWLGAPTSIAFHDLALLDRAARLTVQVRSPGWRPAFDWTPPGYAPLGVTSPGEATRWADGSVAEIECDAAGAVWLRERHGATWDDPVVVSGPAANASEAAVAVWGAGDLAVVWVDSRGGSPGLWYRARVGGVWTDEGALAPNSGEPRGVSIAAEPGGAMQVTWLSNAGGLERVMFMRFGYLSPWGKPIPLSDALPQLDPPTLAMDANGASYVHWVDRSIGGSLIRFRRVVPDSGITATCVLTVSTEPNLGSPVAAITPDGSVHVLWLQGVDGRTQVHYQRRFRGLQPAPFDSLLESTPGNIQDLRVATDADGGLHLATDLQTGGASVLRYQRRHPVRGWDDHPTSLSGAEAQYVAARAVLPDAPDRVTVLALEVQQDGMPHWIERSRAGDQPLVAAVPAAPAGAVAVARAAPNPLRAGQTLSLRLPAAGDAAAVEAYDVLGRRVASAPLERRGDIAVARFPAAVTARWADGIYFVRPRPAPGQAAPPATRIVVLR
ncbi:MAG TPA: M6 family metalloprotease domain-containing protein [Candidatus Eisenbacteria bacterium]|nr:M6 family metalloprotease domain-containing protein [Candidatus Eisenbacteria bacterium]